MIIETGEWAGWKVYLQYVDGTKLTERQHTNVMNFMDPSAPQQWEHEVTVECEYDRDIAIVIEPKSTAPHSHFSALPVIDGRVGGGVVRQTSDHKVQIKEVHEKSYGFIVEEPLRFVDPNGASGGPHRVNYAQVLLSLGRADMLFEADPHAMGCCITFKYTAPESTQTQQSHQAA